MLFVLRKHTENIINYCGQTATLSNIEPGGTYSNQNVSKGEVTPTLNYVMTMSETLVSITLHGVTYRNVNIHRREDLQFFLLHCIMCSCYTVSCAPVTLYHVLLLHCIMFSCYSVSRAPVTLHHVLLLHYTQRPPVLFLCDSLIYIADGFLASADQQILYTSTRQLLISPLKNYRF